MSTAADRLREMVAAATPGPWSLCPNPHYVMAGNLEDGPTLAQIRDECSLVGVSLPQQANAELIALAPDLAALLADAMAELVYHSSQSTSSSGYVNRGAADALLARFDALLAEQPAAKEDGA